MTVQFIKDKEVWIQFQNQLVPLSAVFHYDNIQKICSFCCAHKHNEKNLLCSTSSLVNFQSVFHTWITSTPNPCQSSWKLLSSKKKVIACISVSHKAMAPAELLNMLSLRTQKFLWKKRKSDKFPHSALLTHICYNNLSWENNEDIFHYSNEACDRAGSHHVIKLVVPLVLLDVQRFKPESVQ